MATTTHVISKVATKIISPIVTPILTQVDTAPKVAIGTVAYTDMGGMAEYGVAVSDISQYAFCVLYDGGSAEMATSNLANDGGGSKKLGCPQGSVASGSFGWFMRMGTFIGNVADDCADNVPLFTTATAGYLDDATQSNCLVAGLWLNTTESLATALTVFAAAPIYVAPYTNPA